MFKVNNRNTNKRWKICLKLRVKTPKRRQHHPDVFNAEFEQIPHLSSSVSIVDFEQVNISWDKDTSPKLIAVCLVEINDNEAQYSFKIEAF